MYPSAKLILIKSKEGNKTFLCYSVAKFKCETKSYGEIARSNFSFLHMFQAYGFSLKQGSFHVKWTKAGHDPSQILMRFFQMKGTYEIRLSWKFQNKLITYSKVITSQSWHGKLKIGKTRGGQATWVHFSVSITFFVLNPNFSYLLHCSCAWRTLR